jgi:hypothetical protein
MEESWDRLRNEWMVTITKSNFPFLMYGLWSVYLHRVQRFFFTHLGLLLWFYCCVTTVCLFASKVFKQIQSKFLLVVCLSEEYQFRVRTLVHSTQKECIKIYSFYLKRCGAYLKKNTMEKCMFVQRVWFCICIKRASCVMRYAEPQRRYLENIYASLVWMFGRLCISLSHITSNSYIYPPFR